MADKSDKRNKTLGFDASKLYREKVRNTFISVVYGVFTAAVISVLVLFEVLPTTYDVTVGKASPESIYAIAEIEDTQKTEEAKKNARESVLDIYSADASATAEIQDFFENTVFDGIETVASYGDSIRNQNGDEDGYQVAYDTSKVKSFGQNELSFLKAGQESQVSESKVKAVLDSSADDVAKLKAWFVPVLESILTDGITPANIESIKTSFSKKITETDSTDNTSLKQVVADVVSEKLKTNYYVDTNATELARIAVENAVKPVFIEKGNIVCEKDEIVTQAQYDALKKMGMLTEGGISYRLAICTSALVIILVVLVSWYLFIFERKTALQPKKMLLLSLLCIMNIVVSLVFKSVGWEFVMNTAMCVVLVSIFFNERLAVVVNTGLAIILAMIVSKENDLFGADAIALMISAYAGGMSAIYSCKYITVASRLKLMVPGAISGIVGAITGFVACMLAGKSFQASGIVALYCLAGGLVASILSAGSISIWESAFNLLTQSKLLELSNSSSELLRKISIEIPGTYQHSTIVAELAENAAKDIGANPMLARAASLYHDIGKMRIPECYTENQTDESKNFHSALSPKESAEMIFSHITEGIKMAKENKLPIEIIDVIQQHHGTSAVMYFYNKEKLQNPDADINEFRYPGPNPQTKEAGIILLADCIEASVRSLDEKNNETIRAQVEKMCKARMEDGELDDCDLSLKDINVIKNSFAATLSAIYHGRIKYEVKNNDN